MYLAARQSYCYKLFSIALYVIVDNPFCDAAASRNFFKPSDDGRFRILLDGEVDRPTSRDVSVLVKIHWSSLKLLARVKLLAVFGIFWAV